MIATAHQFVSPNMLLSTHSQKGSLDYKCNWLRVKNKILSQIILFEVNKDMRCSTADGRLGKMEEGGAEEDKSSSQTVMELALANLLSSTSICSTLICLHWVLVQLSMLL